MNKLPHNAKSIYTEANNMNILKPNLAVFSSLLFLLFAVVDTAAAATGEVILKTDGEQNLNALFAEAHPDAVLVIHDKVDEQRVPSKQRLWVWGAAGFLD